MDSLAIGCGAFLVGLILGQSLRWHSHLARCATALEASVETQRDLHAIVKAQHEATAQWAASPPEGLDLSGAEPGGWSVAGDVLTPADLRNVTPLPRRRRDDG